MQPTYFTKQLITASSTLIGVLTTANVFTANAGTAMPLDTPRRVTVWSSAGDLSSLLVTITGIGHTGLPQTEQLVASSAAGLTRATISDFITVTSISGSSTPGQVVNFGTNTQGGTRWRTVNNAVTPINIGVMLTFSSTANSMAATLEYTLDDVTQVYPKPLTTLSTNTTSISFIPTVIASTAITAAASNTYGAITTPISAWRVTLTSTSSGAGLITGTGVQSGIG